MKGLPSSVTITLLVGAALAGRATVARSAPASLASPPGAVAAPDGPPLGWPPSGPGGGPPPFAHEERPLVHQFDADGNGWLDRAERRRARAFLEEERARMGPSRRRHGREPQAPPQPGAKLAATAVPPIVGAGLYDPSVLRTLFLEFEDADWEAELAAFHGTDVDVPATLMVDGKRYPRVGVHFRGASSFMMVGDGYKRSLNVSLDFVDKKQRLYGYRTLNLLNSHEDPSFLRTVLFLGLARHQMAAPRANFVKVAINGESWGVFVNAQQFNKDFIAEAYPGAKGSRWKVKGSPMGRGGLEYIGDDVAAYRRIYTIKSKDDDEAWKSLIALCRTLNQTPTEKLEAALAPILDLDQTLWFLAFDNALANSDGYWVRASDYNLLLDDRGKFHIVPHDTNETFAVRAGGPAPPGSATAMPAGATAMPPPPRRFGTRGPGQGGIEVDPMIGLDDKTKPLRSRLLAVPKLREQYLRNVRTIAERWLDWRTLGPLVRQHRMLIGREVAADTRKLESTAAFEAAVSDEVLAKAEGRETSTSLRAFADGRRAFLLGHPAIKALDQTAAGRRR